MKRIEIPEAHAGDIIGLTGFEEVFIGETITDSVERDPLPDGPDPLPQGSYGHPWIEFRIGNSSLIISPLTEPGPARTPAHVPWVYVDDVTDHYEHAVSNGAQIVTELASPWGLPYYVADDLEGHRWTFAQARPTMR